MALASMPWRLSILFVFCICFITAVSGVKSSDFKTCSQVTPSLLTSVSNPHSRVSAAETVTSLPPSPPTHTTRPLTPSPTTSRSATASSPPQSSNPSKRESKKSNSPSLSASSSQASHASLSTKNGVCTGTLIFQRGNRMSVKNDTMLLRIPC